MKMNESIVVNKSQLLFILDSIDTAMAELEVVVHEGDVDERVTIGLDKAVSIIKEALKEHKD